jgi:SAM-dependent methyltransferase
LIAEFDDPRLVAIYDAVNAYGADEQPDFYGDLAARIGARTVVDLGCGTGLITHDLADRGYRMIGVDPSAEMLAVARRRRASNEIEWIHGGAEQIGSRNADLAFMAGQVAQFFLTDDEWLEALAALHRALRPGGFLAFESRNPDDREWERWPTERHRFVDDARAGRIETWWEFHDMHENIASYTNHYCFTATGETLTSPAALRFRTRPELEHTLSAAGFTVDDVYGDWNRAAVGPTSPELIVVAHR